MREISAANATISALLPKQQVKDCERYKRSQFVIVAYINGISYTYNTLTSKCYQADIPKTTVAHRGYDELIEDYFFVPESKDECAFYTGLLKTVRAFFHKPNYLSYTILPTFACNAKCIYCFEEGTKPISMTDEVVAQTIRFIEDTHRESTINLQWFGGEPLVGIRTIDTICKGLKSAGISYKSSMITNGSLITDEVIQKMKHVWNMNHLQISMDGNEKDYIERKRYGIYADYYHSILRTINKLLSEGIDVHVRCNVDKDNWDTIPEFLDDLRKSVDITDSLRVYFWPLYVNRVISNDISFWKEIYNAKRMVTEFGFKTASSFSINNGFMRNHCMADSSSAVVIGPDGNLYPCDLCSQESCYGNVYEGITNEAVRRAWIEVSNPREKCRDCVFLPQCTSFSMCPMDSIHCKEARMLDALNDLNKIVEADRSTDMIASKTSIEADNALEC